MPTQTSRRLKSIPIRQQRGLDAVDHIFAHGPQAKPDQLPLRWAQMAGSEVKFFRGSAPTFYQLWQRRAPRLGSPAVWLCGDAHLENIGSYRGKNRVAYFDLTDFDDACLAPLEWELGRALVGFHVAGAGSLARPFLSSYRQGLIAGKPRHIEREVAKGAVDKLLRAVAQRKRKEFVHARTRHGRLRVQPGETYALGRAERARASTAFRRWAQHRRHAKFFRILDLCGSNSGVGGLGLRRYLVLVKGGRRCHLIDMKEGAPSALAGACRQAQPGWSCEAERIATVQAYVQYVPIAHLGWLQAGKTSFVISDYQPMEDRIDLSTLPRSEHRKFAKKWGRLLAWAHLRSASWRKAAGIDDLVAFGGKLDLARQRRLLHAAAAIGKTYRSMHREFRELVDAGTATGI